MIFEPAKLTSKFYIIITLVYYTISKRISFVDPIFIFSVRHNKFLTFYLANYITGYCSIQNPSLISLSAGSGQALYEREPFGRLRAGSLRKGTLRQAQGERYGKGSSLRRGAPAPLSYFSPFLS
jgi:hypothetical protein